MINYDNPVSIIRYLDLQQYFLLNVLLQCLMVSHIVSNCVDHFTEQVHCGGWFWSSTLFLFLRTHRVQQAQGEWLWVASIYHSYSYFNNSIVIIFYIT